MQSYEDKTPYVLGVKCGGDPNGDGHSANAAIKHGKNIVAIQAERLDRIKKSAGWRKGISNYGDKNRNDSDFVGVTECIKYCINAMKISAEQIDLVVVDNIGKFPEQEAEIRSVVGKRCPIVQISHHLAHAASAYLCSPFNSAAILVMDGGGGCLDKYDNSYERQSIYLGNGQDILHYHTTRSSRSNIWGLGGAYSIHGMILSLDPGKVMGLAAYGNGESYREYSIFDNNNDIDIFMNSGILYDDNPKEVNVTETNNTYGLLRTWENDPTDAKWADLAYKIQSELEDNLIKLCNRIYDITKEKNICIAGGVALNSSANEKIIEKTSFENIFIQPAADDGGIGLGCALYGDAIILSQKRNYIMKNAYLGKTYSENDVQYALEKYKLHINVRKTKSIAMDCAQLLSEGKIIAWFQGKSEYGPRALGHRSLLCDPRREELKTVMNIRVKGREWWRPLAPSVLEEYAKDYFEINDISPYMLRVARVKKGMACLIPGVKHIDDTSRIQTVSKQECGLYWELIYNFYKLTNVPMILNTSFNLCDEPIVEEPEDAIKTFLKKQCIDFLIINNYIIERI